MEFATSTMDQPIAVETETDFSDAQLRSAVRALLPAEVFQRRPWRLLYAVLQLSIILASAWAAMHTSWYLAVPFSIIMGHAMASLMFFAHEIAHGAVTNHRWLQDLILYVSSTSFCLSPKLWRAWHNRVHHAHANVAAHDPDQFGTMERYENGGFWRKFIIHCAPGSGHILSYIYPFIFFTGMSQGVLWVESAGAKEFRPLNRTRAKIESIVMALLWIALGIATGWRGTLYLIVIPMLAGNFTLMSYIFTNHLFRPLRESASALDGAMSVTSHPIFDRLHFHFSHHIEHHLFPTVSSANYPQVRQALLKLAGDRYLAPPHWWAFSVLFKTPRLYQAPTILLEPISGRTVSLASVEEMLDMH